jgi:hypothetical protein
LASSDWQVAIKRFKQIARVSIVFVCDPFSWRPAGFGLSKKRREPMERDRCEDDGHRSINSTVRQNGG